MAAISSSSINVNNNNNNIFQIINQKKNKSTNTGTSNARCGILLNNTTTPNIICNTHSCALPLITPDLLESNPILKDSIGKLPFAIPVADVILEKNTFKQQNDDKTTTTTIHQHSNIDKSNLIFFTPRICGTILSGPSNDKQITVETAQGRRGVNVDTYFSILNSIQADINVSLCDELPKDASKNRHDKSVRRTLNWLIELLKKKKNQHDNTNNVEEPMLKKQKTNDSLLPNVKKNILFGVILGGTNMRLRKISAESTTELPVDGYVLGGFNLGETNNERKEILTSILPMLNETKCRVLKSANNPIDILESINLGIDLIQCNYPYELTRMGYGSIYNIPSINYNNNNNSERINNPLHCPGGKMKISLRDKRFERDTRPLLPGCQCFTCTSYTRAYINHLLNAHEMLAETLLYIHNLYHLQLLVSTGRKYIMNGKYNEFIEEFKRGIVK